MRLQKTPQTGKGKKLNFPNQASILNTQSNKLKLHKEYKPGTFLQERKLNLKASIHNISKEYKNSKNHIIIKLKFIGSFYTTFRRANKQQESYNDI